MSVSPGVNEGDPRIIRRKVPAGVHDGTLIHLPFDVRSVAVEWTTAPSLENVMVAVGYSGDPYGQAQPLSALQYVWSPSNNPVLITDAPFSDLMIYCDDAGNAAFWLYCARGYLASPVGGASSIPNPLPVTASAFTAAQSLTTVSTTAVQIVASNTDRRGGWIQNLSATDNLYLGLANTVTSTPTNCFHVLDPGCSFPFQAGSACLRGDVYGIRAAGSAAAAVLELDF